jgi:uncharacterized protein
MLAAASHTGRQIDNLRISRIMAAFEWDDKKARANLAKHGVSFEMAREAFTDPFAYEWFGGHEGGEDRFKILGMVNERVLFVVYTLRNDTT